MNHRPHPRQRGFTLLEALVALVIVAFGLLGLAGVNMKLARSEDVAKQRGEAARLAQEKIEELRSFTRIKVAAGAVSWDGLSNGNDTVTDSDAFHTNASYSRSWQLFGAATDAMRRALVTVAWTDRSGEAQSLAFATVISKTDPSDVGSLGFPLPANTTLKRPKNRSLNIPIPAVDIGNGESAVKFQGTNFVVVFSNESGYVVRTCTTTVAVITSAADLSSCTTTNAYIIAGYVSMHEGDPFPAGLTLNTANMSGTTGVTCSPLANAIDQNTNMVIAGYKYYMCVISVAAANDPWSGMVRLAAPALNAGATEYLVCRFQYPVADGGTANQRNVQPYTNVADSLDNQNYRITDSNSCPTVDSLATTLHQNCRSTNPNSNPNRATDCPAAN